METAKFIDEPNEIQFDADIDNIVELNSNEQVMLIIKTTNIKLALEEVLRELDDKVYMYTNLYWKHVYMDRFCGIVLLMTSLMSSIMLAMGLIFLQETTDVFSALEAVVYTRFFSLFSLAVLLFFLKERIFITKKSIPILISQGILESTGNFCIAAAYAFDKVSIAVVISSGFGLVTVLLAKFILKEKISKIQSLGIVLTFIGVVGLTI